MTNEETDRIVEQFLAEREAEHHRDMRSFEAPYERWELVRDQQVRAVDWVAVRDKLGEQLWRTYMGLRHELRRACYPVRRSV